MWLACVWYIFFFKKQKTKQKPHVVSEVFFFPLFFFFFNLSFSKNCASLHVNLLSWCEQLFGVFLHFFPHAGGITALRRLSKIIFKSVKSKNFNLHILCKRKCAEMFLFIFLPLWSVAKLKELFQYSKSVTLSPLVENAMSSVTSLAAG